MAEERTKMKTAHIFQKGIENKDVVARYDSWSENYDEIIREDMYNAPNIILKEILKRVPLAQRRSCRVLDVAAGTGKVGKDLQKEGFTDIDAIEPSEGMLNKLKECSAYNNKYFEGIGAGDSTVPSDTYDLVVICGGMGEGHIPVSGIDDLIRVTKKGGLVIIVMRENFLVAVDAYKDKLEPYMQEMEKKGQWTKVERCVVPNYYFEYNGVVFTYRVA